MPAAKRIRPRKVKCNPGAGDTVVIEFGDLEIELSLDQAESLYGDLADILGDDEDEEIEVDEEFDDEEDDD